MHTSKCEVAAAGKKKQPLVTVLKLFQARQQSADMTYPIMANRSFWPRSHLLTAVPAEIHITVSVGCCQGTHKAGTIVLAALTRHSTCCVT